MADSFQSEDEQVEQLKKWWRENGQSTVITIVLAIAGVFGWQAYQTQQQATVDAASAIYQNLLSAAAGENGVVTSSQKATANHLADTLKNDFSGSTYAQFAALFKAKLAVEANDLATAEQELTWVLAQNPTTEINLQAQLRLARVLFAQDKFDDSLALLNIDAGAYAASYEEVKGDIYLAKGDNAAAKLAYQKAVELAAQAAQPGSNPLLEIKLQQLTSEGDA
ncbi:tetratricopeptide repeat protein [Oceanicoccus sp. KOV_DT_Chl]|uniref:YfgM family protein n=1 Tax=Oceanicoccus sp. KOV_DT_Chl TaxID=1904639 RepID=UPI000C7D3945|nr:tetratricopeptide repeat protein [Oceanicoccus sp. KOV_DT_Chl]